MKAGVANVKAGDAKNVNLKPEKRSGPIERNGQVRENGEHCAAGVSSEVDAGRQDCPAASGRPMRTLRRTKCQSRFGTVKVPVTWHSEGTSNRLQVVRPLRDVDASSRQHRRRTTAIVVEPYMAVRARCTTNRASGPPNWSCMPCACRSERASEGILGRDWRAVSTTRPNAL